jgi:hypothetical protein
MNPLQEEGGQGGFEPSININNTLLPSLPININNTLLPSLPIHKSKYEENRKMFMLPILVILLRFL